MFFTTVTGFPFSFKCIFTSKQGLNSVFKICLNTHLALLTQEYKNTFQTVT